MTVQTVKLGRDRFVILKEKDYRDLKSKAARSKAKPLGKRRLTAQDKGDIAESRRRLKEPGGSPLAQVRQRLGL
ncbi:MAG TPA: hypothetical protein VG269_20650 [Tepidisphaeraceae bacterium]|nr:hypothetical protein [Tepidisphaeraceae bacterium]